MNEDSTKALSKVIRIDESEIRGHLDEMVRGTVEETLNALLDAEADELCARLSAMSVRRNESTPVPATIAARCTPRPARC